MAVTVRVKRKPLFPHFTDNAIAFDTEGTGLISYGPAWYWGYVPARPFAFAFCDGDGHTAYFRYKVNPKTRGVIIEPEGQAILHRLMTEPQFNIIGHNLSYDFRMSEAIDEPIRHRHVDDTMVLAHVATGGDELTYALKPLSVKYLHYSDEDEKQLENAVRAARVEAEAKGWTIAIGKKDLERGKWGVFAGNKPIKADYWLVPSPHLRQAPGTHDIDPDDPDVDLVQRYAIGDVIRAQMMKQFFMPIIQEDERLLRTYRREMQLFWVLRHMERRGTRVYPDHSMYLERWYTAYMAAMKKIGDANGGRGVNYMSPKQLMRIFYEERGYAVRYKERKKKDKVTGETINVVTPTLGKDEFAVIGGTDEDGNCKDPLAKAMLEWRAAKQSIKSFLKIYSTFWYPEELAVKAEDVPFLDDDGRRRDWSHYWGKGTWVLHPNYNQCGAVTGRLTCSDPNLQQVAAEDTGLRRAEIPAKPRECFGPRPGYIWYLPDYSQVEVWAFAFLFDEPEMKKLLLAGHDFHQGVANKTFIFKEDYEDRRKYYRKLAKLIMFGKLYGGGVGTEDKPGRMCKLLDQPFETTKQFIDSFDTEFEAVDTKSKEIIRAIRRTGEWWNVYGRRYVLGRNIAYKGVNYNIQGTCADLLKVALIRLDWMLRRRWPGVFLINTIHDEFMIEVPDHLHCARLMREIMWVMQMDSALLGIPVPLPVGIKMTKWVSAKSCDSTPEGRAHEWPTWNPPWPEKRQIWAQTKTVNLPGMRPSGDSFVFGGAPRDDGPFDHLRRDMQACPC